MSIIPVNTPGKLPEQPIALVTGANRGIGREVAIQLAARGARVILGARSVNSLQEVAAHINNLGQIAHSLELDVVDPASINHAARLIESNYSRVDILINNAGVFLDGSKSISHLEPDRMQKTFLVNTLGPYRLCVALLPLMHKHKCGRIINVSSGMGASDSLSPEHSAYRLSKFMLNQITQLLAADNQGSGIQINAVCPGWVRTDMGGKAAPRSIKQGAQGIVDVAFMEAGSPSGVFYRDSKQINW